MKHGLATLSVRIAAAGEPFAPTLWYRADASGPFTAAGLLRVGDRWEARVPLSRFSYYVEAYDHGARYAGRLGSAQKPLLFPAPRPTRRGRSRPP